MKTILLGFVQGLTEFLPVSSSGHLYILAKYLNLNSESLSFFILLHLATLLAIFIFLNKKILINIRKKNILKSLVIVTIITILLGLTIDFLLKNTFNNTYCIAFLLLVNGGILLSIKNTKTDKNIEEIKIKDSLLLGIIQGLAVFPGISRSGITITTLLKRGFKRSDAFIFSFLMAIPAILGAFLLEYKNLLNCNLSTSAMLFGFISAFVSGLIALAILKKCLLSKHFSKFGYYCIGISFLSLII